MPGLWSVVAAAAAAATAATQSTAAATGGKLSLLYILVDDLRPELGA